TRLGEVSRAAYDALNEAINVARIVANNADHKTQDQLDMAVTSLKKEMTNFKNSVIDKPKDTIIIPLNKLTKVYANQEDIIEGTNVTVTMPSDLVSGTAVMVTDVKEEIKGL